MAAFGEQRAVVGNLSAMRQVDGTDGAPPAWSSEFDQWGAETLREGELDALLDFQHKAPAAAIAHPRIEHFAPLFVSLGASSASAGNGEAAPMSSRREYVPRTVIDGYWYGLAKRSLQFG